MPKKFTSETQKTGEVGENVAVRFLMKHGFSIIERNYTKKWGEIDIVAEKDSRIYFVEVKSVSRVPLPTIKDGGSAGYRPEENMHPWKMKRMARTIQTYLLSNRKYEDREWQVNLLVVYLDIQNKKAKIKVIADIVL